MSSSRGDNVKSTLTWKSAATGNNVNAVGHNTGSAHRQLNGTHREQHHDIWKNDSVLSTSLSADGPLQDRANKRGMTCAEGEAVALAQQKDMRAFDAFGTASEVAGQYTAFDQKTLNLSKQTLGNSASRSRKRLINNAKDAVAGGIHENDLAAINEVLGRAPDTAMDSSVINSQRRIHTDIAIRGSGVFTTENEGGGHRDACAQCQAQIMTRMEKAQT